MINTAGAGVDGLTKYGSLWAVVEAAKAGASDASRAATGFFPAAGRALSKGIHATGYTRSTPQKKGYFLTMLPD
jgi:hypothetical protein